MQRLDHFMVKALTAYYDSRDPLGVEGDFTTAPEISQLFGEIIGIWAAQQWMRMGSPSQFNLIEIGPGRGTLMADLLRGTNHIEPFQNAMHVHLIETSNTLKEKQKQTLNDHNVKCHDHLSEISTDIPAIIIANEFLDALPIRQFKYNDEQWLERYIKGESTIWAHCDAPPLKPTLPKPNNGDIFEYSKAQADYIQLISTFKGATLLIDYGYRQSNYGDTLQALYNHAPCAITDHIDDADLTSHIDFEWLSTFFENPQIKTQGQFLAENGIHIRYQTLNNPELNSGYQRLIHPDQMGDLFKVLEVFNPIP